MSNEIQKIYSKNKIQDRDIRIQSMITDYFKRNMAVLSDGILYKIPILSNKTRNDFSRMYGINNADFDIIKKNKEMIVFKRDGSITELKLGLIISYVETGKPIFLNFLSILIYSSLYFKYFRNGCNSAVLKYTIENQDDRTDFKKYDMSLVNVITKKTEVMVEFIEKSRYIKSGTISDYNLRMLLQALSTRLNAMLRNICGKYMTNMKDDTVKIMIQHSKTLDGKDVISPLSIIEATKEKAADNLRLPGVKQMAMSGMSIPDNAPIRADFMKEYGDKYPVLSEASSMIVTEWVSRHERVNISDFKNKFIKDMSNTRNITHIYDKIDTVTKNDKKLNKDKYRKIVYKFLLANIYLSILDVVKGG